MISNRRAPVRGPIIVLATPRSCSTLLVAALSGHPELCGVPELCLFPAAPIRELLESRFSLHTDSGRWHRHALLRAFAWARYQSMSAADLDAANTELLDMAGLNSAQVMHTIMALVAPRTLVEKSPPTACSDRAFADCLQTFPDALYIHLVRDPVSVARSQVRLHRTRGLYPDLSDHRLFLFALHNWYVTHRRLRAALSRLDSSQWSCVSAEDLRSQPERTLTALLARLRLANEAAVVDRMLHTERWPFASGLGGRYGGDYLFFADPRFRRADGSPVEQPAGNEETLEGVLPPDGSTALAEFARSLRHSSAELLST
jgi:hypothetical protein